MVVFNVVKVDVVSTCVDCVADVVNLVVDCVVDEAITFPDIEYVVDVMVDVTGPCVVADIVVSADILLLDKLVCEVVPGIVSVVVLVDDILWLVLCVWQVSQQIVL